tara:strand:+ start:1175 stop:1876 length:702 start_codon:yes stop_codon:yes gene_type:complete
MRPGDPAAIKNMFDAIAPSYDFLNDFYSFGLHRFWKRRLLSAVSPKTGEKWIDLCCGTGDLTFLLAKAVQPGGQVIGIDSAENPLLIAKKKSSCEDFLSITWYQEDAIKTSLPSKHFDGLIMSYGLRNLCDVKLAFKEIRRVLKKGGKAGILDFNKPRKGSFAFLFQKLYLRLFVVPFSTFFGLGQHYRYLEKSIENFPSGNIQIRLAQDAGFSEANYQLLCGGQMGLLVLTN